jgi:hypothetical protein
MLRIPHCLVNRLIAGGKVVSLTHPPHFTLQKHYYFSLSGTHLCQRLSKPQGLVRPEGLGKHIYVYPYMQYIGISEHSCTKHCGLSNGYLGLFLQWKSGVKLTTHLQMVLRSRKRGSIHPLPHTPSWRSAQLVKHRENFTYTSTPPYAFMA